MKIKSVSISWLKAHKQPLTSGYPLFEKYQSIIDRIEVNPKDFDWFLEDVLLEIGYADEIKKTGTVPILSTSNIKVFRNKKVPIGKVDTYIKEEKSDEKENEKA